MLWLDDPVHEGLLPLRVAPPGAVHVLFTITVLSTDGSNWILQVRVILSPSSTIGLNVVMVTEGVGTRGVKDGYQ